MLKTQNSSERVFNLLHKIKKGIHRSISEGFFHTVCIYIFFLCRLPHSGGTWRTGSPCRPSTQRETLWGRSTCRQTSPPSSPSTASASSTSCREYLDHRAASGPPLRVQRQNRLPKAKPQFLFVDKLWSMKQTLTLKSSFYVLSLK